ncbi:hypothetical protein D3C84_1013750 [compost metagenome]
MLGTEQYLPGAQLIDESGISRISRGPFQAGPGIYRYPQHLQRNAQFIAKPLAMVRPGIGRDLKAVMDMDGRKRRQGFATGEAHQQMKEDSGVESAGEGDAPGRRMAPRGQGGQQAGFEGHGRLG